MYTSRGLELKNEGNRYFKEGDYQRAEVIYGQAIQHDPKNLSLFTNRAFSRLKLEKWSEAESDCHRAIEISRDSLKAYYYLAQAQVELKHSNEAYASALRAYDLCMRDEGSSARHISGLILKIKKAVWEDKERRRKRERRLLVVELEDSLEQAAETEKRAIQFRQDSGDLSNSDAESELGFLREATAKKVNELKSVFSIADMDNSGERTVPDWLIDNISFEIMHDPWITKTGHSYEKSNIFEHLKHSPYDPLTREPLSVLDLRPNVALRNACAEFLENNGWAVDY